jgi:ABC-2 type transport system ATP-binding protein
VAAVVVAESVSKRWGSTLALDNATFVISDGVTGLLGANGAGKTTMLGMMLGLHHPDGGSVTVLGRDPFHAGAEVRARIGYAPEHNAMPPDVAAHDLVRHIAEIHGLPFRAANARASDALYEVGLGEERFRPVGTMSTGQRQRVKLAQAIVHDPDLVLLDEPTDGLDPVQRDQMLGLIWKVGHELGLDVVLSSHLLHEVDRVCDAVVILDEGRAVESGRLADLRQTATASEVLIDVDGDRDVLLAKLTELGVSAAASDGTSVVATVTTDEMLDLVRDALADTGVGVRRLQRRTRSLEEVYLGASGMQPS